MPTMSALDDLFSRLPIGQIADKLGVDQDTAARAVAVALPTILGGMKANADDPRGADRLAKALADHDDDDDFDVASVDEADGRKIVKHVFGKEQDAVVDRLANAPQLGGLSSGLLVKLLPLLAPLIMKFLGGMFSGKRAAPSRAAASEDRPGGGIGDILGGLLGGGSGGASGGGLGSILGSMFGKGDSGGGLGDMLGGLFGGGDEPEERRTTSRSGKRVQRVDEEQDSGGGLMDILGGLLGGGTR